MFKLLQNKFATIADNWFKKKASISEKNYFTNVYGLARTLLAIGILIPLIFDSKFTIFPLHLLEINRARGIDFLNSINIFFLFDYEYFFLAKSIAILILVFVVLGITPRWTGILHWWITFSYFTATGLPEGGDQINSILTFLLIPITLLDSRSNHWFAPETSNRYKNYTAHLVFLIIQIQMAVIYFHAATEKIYKLDLWLDGTALYYWLNDSVFGMSEWLANLINPIINVPFILSMLTWGVFIFELILSAALFMDQNSKRKLLKYAVLFHFLIILFHGLVSFFFAMSGGLLLYLIPKNLNLKIPFKEPQPESILN
ncbi:sporulation-delaying protein SdpB family protein [Algoriphagus sp.]|uniref:sporulation-delaying protein SdpB family protein n=1 Tax=Algoriphagus sp. TaxID=1872435 RepID=UPI003F6FFF42